MAFKFWCWLYLDRLVYFYRTPCWTCERFHVLKNNCNLLAVHAVTSKNFYTAILFLGNVWRKKMESSLMKCRHVGFFFIYKMNNFFYKMNNDNGWNSLYLCHSKNETEVKYIILYCMVPGFPCTKHFFN